VSNSVNTGSEEIKIGFVFLSQEQNQNTQIKNRSLAEILSIVIRL
jgi:hypothetical protein